MPTYTPARRSAPALQRFAFWLLIYTAFWVLLAEGEGWIFGAVSAVLASWLATALRLAAFGLRLGRLPFFAGFFLASAFNGALDVARRALHPRLPIDPSWERYPFRTKSFRIRLLMSAVVGLFPGTLGSKMEAGELHMHVLNRNRDWFGAARQLENQLCALFGEPCGTQGGTR